MFALLTRDFQSGTEQEVAYFRVLAVIIATETMSIIKDLFFEIYEWTQLRGWQGVGRATNPPYPERNEEFYIKLETTIAPLLIGNGYKKVKKRRFIKVDDGIAHFYEFDLTKRRNGIKVAFGSISLNDQVDINTINGSHSLTTYGQYGKNWQYLKPRFWAYDYEYPVKKNNRKDELVIKEIELIIVENLKSRIVTTANTSFPK